MSWRQLMGLAEPETAPQNPQKAQADTPPSDSQYAQNPQNPNFEDFDIIGGGSSVPENPNDGIAAHSFRPAPLEQVPPESQVPEPDSQIVPEVRQEILRVEPNVSVSAGYLSACGTHTSGHTRELIRVAWRRFLNPGTGSSA